MSAPALVELLRRRYGVAVERVTPFFELPERAVYRADVADGPSLVVRVFPPSRPLERVAGDAAVLRYVAAAGIAAERHVPAGDGRPCVELDGRGVLVTGLVAGERPGPDPDAVRQLGELAGRLSRLRPPPGDPLVGRRAGALPSGDLAAAGTWLAQARAGAPEHRRGEVERLAAVVAATRDCEDLPLAVIHPDCQIINAVREPAGRVVLIDWDGAGVGPRVVPLGLVLFSCVAAGPLDLALVEPIVEGFRRHGSLTGAELDRLPDAIRFRPLAVAARELAASVARGDPHAPEGWWSGHVAAEAVAELARQCMT